MTPQESIDQAFLQLTFAIKLLMYVEKGKVEKSDFDCETQVNLRRRNLSFPEEAFNTYDDIVTAAQNNYLITLGFTSMVLDQELEAAGYSRDMPKTFSDRDLRALIYMIRCAFSHPIALSPRWEARGTFARELTIKLPSGPLILEMGTLNGQPFDDLHIGGVENYFELKDEAIRLILSCKESIT